MYKTAADWARKKNNPDIVKFLTNYPSQLIASVTAENDQLSKENALLKQQIDAKQQRISELEKENDTKQLKIIELEKENSVLKEKNDQIQNRICTLEGEHSKKKSKVFDKSHSDREESLKKKVKKKKIKLLEKQKVPLNQSFNILNLEMINKLRNTESRESPHCYLDLRNRRRDAIRTQVPDHPPLHQTF